MTNNKIILLLQLLNEYNEFEKDAVKIYQTTNNLEPYQGTFILKNGKMLDLDDAGHRDLNTYEFCVKTGALRARTTPKEFNISFLKNIVPTKKQLETIKNETKFKELNFDIIDYNIKTNEDKVLYYEKNAQLSNALLNISRINNE